MILTLNNLHNPPTYHPKTHFHTDQNVSKIPKKAYFFSFYITGNDIFFIVGVVKLHTQQGKLLKPNLFRIYMNEICSHSCI